MGAPREVAAEAVAAAAGKGRSAAAMVQKDQSLIPQWCIRITGQSQRPSQMVQIDEMVAFTA